MSGAGDLVARVEAPRFELFRAVSGRRTAAEIAGYGWDREPDPELLLAADVLLAPGRFDRGVTPREAVASPSG